MLSISLSYVLVVGMTDRAYHGPSNMTADVPGVPTASAREDRLCPKGRLRQQPAGDIHQGEPEPGNEDKASQRLSRRKQVGPDKSDRGQGREWRTPRPASANQRSKTLSHDGIRGKREGICLPDAGPGMDAQFCGPCAVAKLTQTFDNLLMRSYVHLSTHNEA
jgi:hypothetical protein